MKRTVKILMADKYYFIKGGAERYFFELMEIFRSHGHQIIPFSMQHPENFDTQFQDYFVRNIEFNQKSILDKIITGPKVVERIIYSFHSKSRIEKLIDDYKPDIAHLHMIDHQISPSILHSLKKRGIPIVQTVHQYKMVCPNYLLYIPAKSKVCEKCIQGRYFYPIIEKCHKNSILASTLIAIEAFIHKMIKIYNNIDIFHVPSNFMGRKLKEGGIKDKKIAKLYYSINMDEYPFSAAYDDYFIYFGRLSSEKGILTLLKAMEGVHQSKLLIIGDGPQRRELEKFVVESNLINIKFLGNKSKEELKSIISKARFVVVPSEWYDNSPLVIYESFSMGKPVIGTNIGGISELIDHEQNGLLFQAGNITELSEKINLLLTDSKLALEFGNNARLKAEREFNPQTHYERMCGLYQKLLN